MHRVAPRLVVGSLLVAAGCDGGMSIEDFITATTDATCGMLFECCDPAVLAEMDGFGIDLSSEDACRESYGSFASLQGALFQSSIDAGRMEYDAEMAQTCVDAMESLTCTDFFSSSSGGDLTGSCELPFKPKVSAGGSCQNEVECIDGFCDGLEGFGGEGTCAAFPGVGGDCEASSFQCEEGLACSYDFDASGFRCAEQAELGESCDALSCVEGTYCSYDAAAGESVCQELPELGDPCTGVCAMGSYCAFDTNICTAQRADGQPCESGTECLGGLCEEDGTCGSFGGMGCGP